MHNITVFRTNNDKLPRRKNEYTYGQLVCHR